MCSLYSYSCIPCSYLVFVHFIGLQLSPSFPQKKCFPSKQHSVNKMQPTLSELFFKRTVDKGPKALILRQGTWLSSQNSYTRIRFNVLIIIKLQATIQFWFNTSALFLLLAVHSRVASLPSCYCGGHTFETWFGLQQESPETLACPAGVQREVFPSADTFRFFCIVWRPSP